MVPARVEAHPKACGMCEHHSRPTWNTQGFGTCSEVVRRQYLKVVNAPSQAYLATHESFSCPAWKRR